MKLIFKSIKHKYNILLFYFIALFFLIIPQIVYSAEMESWQPAPEANYAEILELIAMRAKANYDNISTWQGRAEIFATDHFYGPNAAQKTHSVDTNSIAKNSQHICETAKTIAEFAVDMPNDKLYSDFRPTIQYKAIDLDQNVPLSNFVGDSPPTKTILTHEIWMHYEPMYKYRPKYHEGKANKMAFIDAPQEGTWNTLDPRRYFNIDAHNKPWEVIYSIRKALLENGNIRIEDYPFIEITFMKTSNGIKYHIMNTFKGGDIIKYIRITIEVDELFGFNVTKREETCSNGIKRYSTKYTYEDLNGVFVPKTYWMESRNNNDEIEGTSEVIIETTGLNKPLSEDIFSIKNLGVEEDTLVTDNIKKAEFRFSKGNLVSIAEPNTP
jgi:hypothetical protein